MKTDSSDQTSNSLFYKASIILIVSIVIIGTSLDYLINRSETEVYYQRIVELNKPLMLLINDRLQRHPQAKWQQQIADINSVFNLSVSLFEIAEFAGDEAIITDLAKGNIVSLFGNEDDLSLYMQIIDSPFVLELDTQSKSLTKAARWIPLLFYILIIMVVYVLTRPFTRQLLSLKRAAKKIGKGDFSTRLTMPKNSTLFPIADAFDTMTAEIETLMLRQRDLTNAVSHELRTPLARLKFAFEALEIQSQDQEWIENIDEMRSDVIELEKLIDEMLLYAQANQIKKFEKKEIRVLELVQDLIASMHSGKIKIIKNMDATINLQTIIFADEHLLFRALSNILRNSISFSKDQCRMDVMINNKKLSIKIIDDGPGIDNKIKNRVFEPFVKIDTSNRKSGYGLGLAIAKNIINKHKGTISVTNTEHHGACFSIELPIN
jgi:two-component system OmpR family sensor kinase/two-component system sensor histidine kinase RstB